MKRKLCMAVMVLALAIHPLASANADSVAALDANPYGAVAPPDDPTPQQSGVINLLLSFLQSLGLWS